ncbi:MAG: hypothetical protein FJW14_12280 [Acidimicrobiia bacterium]|nr:hypothetical protein [Acidimicrobiia bacterium]
MGVGHSGGTGKPVDQAAALLGPGNGRRAGVGARLILAKRHLPVLTAFAASNVLLAFHGTLAPIARTPAAARMRPVTRRLLARVVRSYPCVVISGRPLDDLTRLLRGVPAWHVVSDHGFESESRPATASAHVRGWVEQLGTRRGRRGGRQPAPVRRPAHGQRAAAGASRLRLRRRDLRGR